jgi:hypothetical protein
MTKAPQSFKTSRTTKTSYYTQSLTDRQDGNSSLHRTETLWAKHCCFVDNSKNVGSGHNKLFNISAASLAVALQQVSRASAQLI